MWFCHKEGGGAQMFTVHFKRYKNIHKKKLISETVGIQTLTAFSTNSLLPCHHDIVFAEPSHTLYIPFWSFVFTYIPFLISLTPLFRSSPPHPILTHFLVHGGTQTRFLARRRSRLAACAWMAESHFHPPRLPSHSPLLQAYTDWTCPKKSKHTGRHVQKSRYGMQGLK